MHIYTWINKSRRKRAQRIVRQADHHDSDASAPINGWSRWDWSSPLTEYEPHARKPFARGQPGLSKRAFAKLKFCIEGTFFLFCFLDWKMVNWFSFYFRRQNSFLHFLWIYIYILAQRSLMLHILWIELPFFTVHISTNILYTFITLISSICDVLQEKRNWWENKFHKGKKI